MKNLSDVESYKVVASDGDVGSVVGFLLDDERWTVRYLVVETGGFVGGRRLLVSPIGFRKRPNPHGRFHLGMTIDKVQKSPSIDLTQPISRKQEREFNDYNRYPPYWGLKGLWGAGAHPSALVMRQGSSETLGDTNAAMECRLRSDKDLRGLEVQGRDGEIGRISDFIIDAETWEVRYWVVATGSWWPEHRVLIAPQWATLTSATEQSLHVDISRESFMTGPAWNPAVPIGREYETRLYGHYARPVYWDTENDPVLASATPSGIN